MHQDEEINNLRQLIEAEESGELLRFAGTERWSACRRFPHHSLLPKATPAHHNIRVRKKTLDIFSSNQALPANFETVTVD